MPKQKKGNESQRVSESSFHLLTHSIWCDCGLNVLSLTGGPRAALWLGGGPRGSRLQRAAGHPVPAPAAGRPPAGGGGGHITWGRVGQRKYNQRQRRRARLAVSQGPPRKPEPAEAPEPTGWGGGGVGLLREDQGRDAEEVVPHPAERPAASRAPPSPDHPQRLLQGCRRSRKRGGASKEPAANPTAVQPVRMKRLWTGDAQETQSSCFDTQQHTVYWHICEWPNSNYTSQQMLLSWFESFIITRF